MKGPSQRLLPFVICKLRVQLLNCQSLQLPLTVFLQLLLPIVHAQAADNVDATASADGSQQPSLAAQSPISQKPLQSQDDGRTADGKEGLHVAWAWLMRMKLQIWSRERSSPSNVTSDNTPVQSRSRWEY